MDDRGNIYVIGGTYSTNFPIQQAIQNTCGSCTTSPDVFVTQIISAGGVYTFGFSTYLGGNDFDFGWDIAVDNSGSFYITGETYSTNFPTWQATQGDQLSSDVFVTKIISASGIYTLGYSTYLGGGGTSEIGTNIDIDDSGNVYITGQTNSTAFPTWQATQDKFGGGFSDAFVTKIISTSGGYTYGYSTYLGGTNADSGHGITIDTLGNIYVAGGTSSSDFPTRKAIQGDQPDTDVFVTQIISTGGVYTYGYSTYLGGSSNEDIGRIAVDNQSNAYIVGYTDSSDFPTRGAILGDMPGADAFVTKIITTGGVYTYGYSTYLGGVGDDYSYDIAVDSAGHSYVTGWTDSINFPTYKAIQGDQGGTDAFVTQIIGASGVYTYGYSTYLGGSNYDSSMGIAIDNLGNVYITGQTNSTNFLTQNATQGTNGGLDDAFVAKINSTVPTCFAQVNSISTTFSSSDAQAVQQAVDAASNGDLVKVAGYCAGVSTRAGLTQTVYISKPLTLQGGYTSTNWITPNPLSYPTTLDAQSLGRVAVITGTIPVTIADLNIINGNAQSGGGIYNSGVLTLSHTLVSSNTAAGGISFGGGGGIYNLGTLTLADTTVKGNKTHASGGIHDARGGGIKNQNGSVTLNNSAIMSNSTIVEFGGPIMGHAEGGGIYNTNGSFTLNNSLLSYNSNQGLSGSVSGIGGGAFNYQGTLTLNSSRVFSNTTIGAGGGIYNYNGSGSGNSLVIMNNNVIHNNVAYNSAGGGIYNETTQGSSNSLVILTNSTISSNTTSIGGGVYNRSYDGGNASITLINSTISNNVANSTAGAIYNESDWGGSASSAILKNSTVSGNTAGTGSGIYNISDHGGKAIFTMTNTLIASNFPGGNCFNSLGMIVSNGYNLENGNTCSLIHPSDIPNTNPLLGPLQDNGGATLTHALLPGSPAINAGDNVTCAATPINGVDQRGFPRDAACDIGAYEASAPVLTLAKTANLSTVIPGERITYTLVISNNGPISATQAVISDTLPIGLFLAGPVMLNPLSAGSVGTPPILVNNLTVASGQLITVTFPVTVSSNLVGGTVLTNVATITSFEISRPVTGTAVISIASVPAITITKLVNTSTANIGDTITYTYRVTNTGNVTLTGVTASDDKLGQIALTQTVLAPNQSTSGLLTYTVAETDLPGPLTNTVIVTGTPPVESVVTATDQVSVALVAAPAVTVSKTASLGTAKVGQTITYTYRITNSGNITLTAVSAGDDKLGQVSLSQTTLTPGQSASGTLTHTVVAGDLPGPLVNTVVVTGTPLEGPVVTAAAKVSVALLPPDESVYLPLIVKNH